MSAVDRSLVANLQVFAGLAPADLDVVLQEARVFRRPRNNNVFQQGEPADSIFLLLHGHVRATKTTLGGQQIVVRYVSPGEIFGVATAIGLAEYPATATVVDDSIVLAWPSAAWPRLVEKYPALSASTMRTVGARLQDSHTRIAELSTEQVEQRVAHALLRLMQQAGRRTESGIEIDFPISRQDIAEMTGTTLHTVSRVLSAWEAQGLMRGGRQRIVIGDPHKLAALAEDPPL